jgi:hypothetical protein
MATTNPLLSESFAPSLRLITKLVRSRKMAEEIRIARRL